MSRVVAKKVFAWLIVCCVAGATLLAIFLTVRPTNVAAADGYADAMYNISTAQQTAQTLKKCIQKVYIDGNTDAIFKGKDVTYVGSDSALGIESYGTSNPFTVLPYDPTKEINSSSCTQAYNSFTSAGTAGSVGVSKETLLCGSDNKGGILKMYYYAGRDAGYVEYTGGDCSAHLDGSPLPDGTQIQYRWNDYDSAKDPAQKAYDQFVASTATGAELPENLYSQWGQVDSGLTNVQTYFTTLHDFINTCTDGGHHESMSAQVNQDQYFSTGLYYYIEGFTGAQLRFKMKSGLNSWTNKNQKAACEQMINDMNSLHEGIDDMINQLNDAKLDEQNNAIKEKCNSDAEAAIADWTTKMIEYRDAGDYDNGKLYMDAINSLQGKATIDADGNDQYWYMEGKNAKCLEYTDPSGSVVDNTPSTTTDPDNSTNAPDESGDSSLYEGSDDADISQCKRATSLGWIVCPFMSLIGNALTGLYSQLSDQWIAIDADEVSVGSPLYASWTQFRDYANIGFAILFAVVVFSQVTGIGLSNYSIKKMLPTLIMIAVLVNISFFICQIAVDVTNIVGESIGTVLEDIGNGALRSAREMSGWDYAKGVTASIFSAAGIGLAGYAAGTVLLPFIGSTVIIPVILAAISALIGYFFLLILMALRKAIIYVAILVAPLAFICYAFPNTKSLFDKWKKLFMNLLLVFPICQILVYGGQMMSKIMIASDEDGFFFQFTAMLMQIVPIFFIPMVLRNSMSMLGNIGTRLSQMGARVGHGLSGMAGKSQLANRAAVGLNKWGANATRARLARAPKTKLGAAFRDSRLGRTLQAGSRAKAADSLTKAEELRQSDNRASNIVSDGFMGNVAASANFKAEEEFGDNYVAGLISGAETKADGKRYDMNDLRHEVGGEGEDGDLVKLYDQLLRSDNDQDHLKLKGLTKHLMNIKGGKGLAVMAAAMRKRGGAVFNEDGSLRGVNDTARKGFNAVARYATNNEKWNMMTKRWDPNMTNLLNDGAVDSDDKITDRGTSAWAYYNAGASGKSTPAQMINHDDSYFDGLKNLYGSEAGYEALKAEGDIGDELRASIAAYQGHAQEVFDNPRVYSQAGGALRDIQGVSNASQAYAATISRLEQEARAQNDKTRFEEMRKQVKKEMEGKYKQMAPRTSMNVPH